jgi:hypothetical protein
MTPSSRAHSRIASIVFRTPHDRFTIRVRRPSGARTELAERLAALESADRHLVMPHYVAQACVTRPRSGQLVLVLVVPTEALFRYVLERAPSGSANSGAIRRAEASLNS